MVSNIVDLTENVVVHLDQNTNLLPGRRVRCCTRSQSECGWLPAGCPCWTSWCAHPAGRRAPGAGYVYSSRPAQEEKTKSILPTRSHSNKHSIRQHCTPVINIIHRLIVGSGPRRGTSSRPPVCEVTHNNCAVTALGLS